MHKNVCGYEEFNKINSFYSISNGNIQLYLDKAMNYKIIKEINFGIFIE